jgi:hypothetical protein
MTEELDCQLQVAINTFKVNITLLNVVLRGTTLVFLNGMMPFCRLEVAIDQKDLERYFAVGLIRFWIDGLSPPKTTEAVLELEQHLSLLCTEDISLMDLYDDLDYIPTPTLAPNDWTEYWEQDHTYENEAGTQTFDTMWDQNDCHVVNTIDTF